VSDARVDDLLSLDRDVARGWAALARWRSAVARDPEAHADDEPLDPVRRVAGKSTWDALRALSPPAAELSLRDALLPWVGALTIARLVGEDDVAWARAAADARIPFHVEPPRLVSWRQAWRGVVTARSAAEAALWLAAAGDAGDALEPIARARAEKRVEIARRLGREHPWDLLDVGPAATLRAAARRLLDATDDLSRAIWKGARGGAAEVLHGAVGREAGEGWPARLTRRWREELFGAALAGLKVEPPPVPVALGAASFMRALYDLGFATRLAAAPSAMPFALAREPGARAAHRLGFVFAGLAPDPEWQVRALGLGRRTALRQARVLARTALLDARLHAARLLLAGDLGPVPRDLFGELGERLFGAPLDPRLRGAWPGARDDEPSRFVALVESLPFTEALRDRFDADWFRNPRAWAHVRAVSAVPAAEPHDAKTLDAGVDRLARAFEGALG
jgi:hypothetical protein